MLQIGKESIGSCVKNNLSDRGNATQYAHYGENHNNECIY